MAGRRAHIEGLIMFAGYLAKRNVSSVCVLCTCVQCMCTVYTCTFVAGDIGGTKFWQISKKGCFHEYDFGGSSHLRVTTPFTIIYLPVINLCLTGVKRHCYCEVMNTLDVMASGSYFH